MAKETLRKLGLLQSKIEMRKEELEYLDAARYSLGGFDYGKERVQSSGPSNRVEDLSVRYMDLQRKISELVLEYVQEKERIISLIEMIDDSRFIQILDMHYIRGMTFDEMVYGENSWCYSSRQTYRLHGLALSALDVILQSEEQKQSAA